MRRIQRLGGHLKAISHAYNLTQVGPPLSQIKGDLLGQFMSVAPDSINQVSDFSGALINIRYQPPTAFLFRLYLNLVYDKVRPSSAMDILLLLYRSPFPKQITLHGRQQVLWMR